MHELDASLFITIPIVIHTPSEAREEVLTFKAIQNVGDNPYLNLSCYFDNDSCYKLFTMDFPATPYWMFVEIYRNIRFEWCRFEREQNSQDGKWHFTESTFNDFIDRIKRRMNKWKEEHHEE